MPELQKPPESYVIGSSRRLASPDTPQRSSLVWHIDVLGKRRAHSCLACAPDLSDSGHHFLRKLRYGRDTSAISTSTLRTFTEHHQHSSLHNNVTEQSPTKLRAVPQRHEPAHEHNPPPRSNTMSQERPLPPSRNNRPTTRPIGTFSTPCLSHELHFPPFVLMEQQHTRASNPNDNQHTILKDPKPTA